MPEADKLALLRKEIDEHSDRLKTVLRRADMRREIFDGIPDKEDAAVEAFVESNKESALKVRPKVRRCLDSSHCCHSPFHYNAQTPGLHAWLPRVQAEQDTPLNLLDFQRICWPSTC